MSDQELKDLVASLAVESKKTDKGIEKLRKSQAQTDKGIEKLRKSQAQTDEQMKKTDEKLERIGIRLGSISNNQGDVAEEFFWNTISANPNLGGIKYDFANKNAHKRIKNTEDEYDILLVNGKDVAIIETKYKAHENDVIALIQRKYKNFKILYPEYKNYNHHLALASFSIDDSVKQEALKNNIMLLQRKGKLIETILP